MNRTMISALSAIAGATVGAVAGAAVVGKKVTDEKNKQQQYADKHLALFLMMNQWVNVKQEGKNLAEYFERKGYKNIAIYGMSYAGATLLAELKNSAVCIKYAIDKNADRILEDVDVITLEDDLQEVDVVVVTAITFFYEIAQMLEKKLDCPIVSLEDILYEV